MKSIRALLNSVQKRPFLGLFALVAGATYLQRAWVACGGHLSPPLDDTYIYLQYARRLAEGHGFSYSGEAPPSTGSTSLLHLLLLVPGWWAGLRDSGYLVLPLSLGIICLAVALMGVAAAASGASERRLTAPGPALPAGIALALTALSGHLLWGALTGMDTILFMAGLAWVLALLARQGVSPPGRFWILGGLLSWLRPEGVVFAGVAGLVAAGRAFRSRRQAAPPAGEASEGGALAGWRGPALAVTLLAVPFLVNYAVSGSFQSDGMQAKSLFSEPRPEVIRKSLLHLPEIWRRIALLYLTDFGNGERLGSFRFLQTALVSIGLGAGLLLGLGGRRGAAGLTAAAWVLLFVTLTAMTVPWYGHNFRYQIPGIVPVALLTALGWSAVIARLPGRTARWAGPVLVALFLLVQAPGAWRMREVYAANCQNIRDQQERVGRWIRANTPQDALIGMNDAGAIAYYGERATLDLIGLTSHGWAIRAREGSGALFEQLERLPVSERPTLFALYPTWFPGLAGTRLLGQRLFEADLENNTICGYRTKIVYAPDWSVAGSGALPALPPDSLGVAGLRLVDEIDVGDRVSERAHDYEAGLQVRDTLRELPAGLPGGPGVVDGGRRTSDFETFHARLDPDRPARLVLRTETPQEYELRITLDGQELPPVRLPASRERWSEVSAAIPSGWARSERPRIEIRRHPPRPAVGQAGYHYWIYQ